MHEGRWETTGKPPEGVSRPRFMASERLVLAHHPAHQVVIHVFPDHRHRRAMEAAVVLLPSFQDRIEHRRQIAQFAIAHQLQMPSPNGLPHCLEGITADRRGEVHVDPLILVHRLTRPEGVSQEGELHIRMCLPPVDVLAVDDPCLARMQFEPALAEPLADPVQRQLCLSQALAMDYPVIGGITAEPYAAEVAGDPNIESVVQEQIGQQRAHHPSNNLAKKYRFRRRETSLPRRGTPR